MIDNITNSLVPEWLMTLTTQEITTLDIPLENILNDSLYYPAAGFDGDPAKYLAGNTHSFVYVDYDKSKTAFTEEIGNKHRNFRGYELVGKRDVSMKELIPKGWIPQVLPGTGENSSKYKSWIEKPYCVWAIFQRLSNYDSKHGPKRFSLLYLCADGAAAYQALFNNNGYVPMILAIIQPGYGFGGNYTDFTNPEGILARSIKANDSGIPKYLLNGGIGDRDYYLESIWPEYRSSKGWAWVNTDKCVHLWERD